MIPTFIPGHWVRFILLRRHKFCIQSVVHVAKPESVVELDPKVELAVPDSCALEDRPHVSVALGALLETFVLVTTVGVRGEVERAGMQGHAGRL